MINRHFQRFISYPPPVQRNDRAIEKGQSKKNKNRSSAGFTPQQNGQSIEVHDAIKLSRWILFPWGVENNKDSPIKRARWGWVGWQEVTKPLQWFKRPEEAEKISIKQGGRKNHNKKNKNTGWWITPFTKTNSVWWMPPNSHVGLE